MSEARIAVITVLVDFTVINVLHTVHSIAIIQVLLFVFCSQSTYYA